MNPVANSVVLTSVLVIIDICSERKRTFSKYLLIFMLFLGITYTFKANAEEYVNDPLRYDLLFRQYVEEYEDEIDPDECMFEKWRLHGIHGKKLYKRAQCIVWYLPNTDDSELAKSAFITAMSGIPNASVTGKICTMTLTYLTQYGLDCMEKYKLVNNYLHRAEYHFEMHEFYEQVMDQALPKGYVVIHKHVDEDEQG